MRDLHTRVKPVNKVLREEEKKKERSRCYAAIILGKKLSSSWAQCKKRVNGLCCKDCPEVTICPTPCSQILLYFKIDDESFNFEGFKCRFYCTPTQAVMRRIAGDT